MGKIQQPFVIFEKILGKNFKEFYAELKLVFLDFKQYNYYLP